MRRLLGILVLVAIVVVAVGFYQGWFELSTTSADQKTNISITVDKQKFRQDEQKAAEELRKLGDQLKSKTNEDRGPLR